MKPGARKTLLHQALLDHMQKLLLPAMYKLKHLLRLVTQHLLHFVSVRTQPSSPIVQLLRWQQCHEAAKGNS
eukprot:6491382-Amphidinium_carterae.3